MGRAHGRAEVPGGVEAATAAEEAIDAFALGRAAEDALAAGDAVTARDGLLAAAAAHRRAGRSFAAIDACYLALAVAPADVDLHVLLTELYLERGWRGPAVDKLLLLGRLADLAEDSGTRERLCAIATDRCPTSPARRALRLTDGTLRGSAGPADGRRTGPDATLTGRWTSPSDRSSGSTRWSTSRSSRSSSTGSSS